MRKSQQSNAFPVALPSVDAVPEDEMLTSDPKGGTTPIDIWVNYVEQYIKTAFISMSNEYNRGFEQNKKD